jgi:pimeloyl-ACP methyl ester carboxylesterase
MKIILQATCLIAGIWLPVAASAQDAPVMMSLATGSEVATWTLAPDKPAHKTPVIFLHGGPGMYTTAGVFVKGAPLRAAGFTTIYFDQAGGGKSKRLPAANYTIERAIADLEALRVKLGQDQLILWGSSYGAGLATIYAARYPAHVSAVILTSPGSYPGTRASHNYKPTNRDKVTYTKELSAAVRKVDRDGPAAETTLSQDSAGRLFDDIVNADLMGGMVCKGATIKAPPPGVGGNLYANRMIAKDLDKLKFGKPATIAVPALIIRGACDFLPESNAASFAALFSTNVTTIPATGHGLLENREAIDAAFAAFANGKLRNVK